MGDRYILTVTCSKCGFFDDDVYYAPTCGFTEWECPQCHEKVNLGDYTGITTEMASNKDIIRQIVTKSIPSKER